MKIARPTCLTIVCVLLSLVGGSSTAQAWCHKEHAQFARLAAEHLLADPATPPEFKAWLEQACPKRLDMAGEEDYFMHQKIGLKPLDVFGPSYGVIHWAYMPDIHQMNDPADSKDPVFHVHERLLHFIDLEYFLNGDMKRAFNEDLSSKPKVEDVPDDMNDARYVQSGFLPLRVKQCYEQMVQAIRDGRLSMTSDTDENNAVHWAGYLAHYAADNTQPQHATIDYKSASFFKNPRKAPNVHATVEYSMCDDAKQDYPELRKEFWPIFTKQLETFVDPIETEDPFRATVEVSLKSYDALPLIGHAAVASTQPAGPDDKTDVIDVPTFFHFKGAVDGVDQTVMEMKARQTAWAVKRIERLWKQAWVEGAKK